MSFADDVRATALHLVEALEEGGIDYALMGGIVVSVWAIPRATFDVDLTVSLDEASFPALFRALRNRGFSIDPSFESGFRDLLSGMKKLTLERWTDGGRRVEIDAFEVTTPYQAAAFARRRRVKLDGREAWVLAPTDLILHKLIADRAKDRADVQNLLLVRGQEESEYLVEWATKLGVKERLVRALQEAGL